MAPTLLNKMDVDAVVMFDTKRLFQQLVVAFASFCFCPIERFDTVLKIEESQNRNFMYGTVLRSVAGSIKFFDM